MHTRPFKNDRELDHTLAIYYSNAGRVIEVGCATIPCGSLSERGLYTSN